MHNLDYDYINFQSLGLTQSNFMDLYLLSRSVVGVGANFDNSKDGGEGCAVNPSESSKALVLILVFWLQCNVVLLI